MELAKLLEHKHQPSSSSSLMTWPAMEPSSSSAFQKYTRLTTTPQRNDDSATSISKPLVAFPPFAWTNLSDPKSTELKNSTAKDEVKAYQSATTSNLLFFNGLSHRPTAARQPKKHSAERRPRTTFNVEQTCKLEDEYKKNEYVSRSKRVKLAQLLELSEGQVKIWFQNRRAKDKRIEKAQLDQRVRYIALNMAAMSCPGLLTATSTYDTSIQQEDDN